MALTTPNAPRLRIYLRTFIDLTDGVWPSPNGLPQGHTVDSWVRNYMDTGFGDVLLAEALGAPRGHLSGLIDRVEFVEDSDECPTATPQCPASTAQECDWIADALARERLYLDRTYPQHLYPQRAIRDRIAYMERMDYALRERAAELRKAEAARSPHRPSGFSAAVTHAVGEYLRNHTFRILLSREELGMSASQLRSDLATGEPIVITAEWRGVIDPNVATILGGDKMFLTLRPCTDGTMESADK